MKFRSKKIGAVAFFMVVLMLISLFVSNISMVFADEESNSVQAENLDIVFVIDDTRSMIENDPSKLSGSAIRQTLTMIPEDRISSGNVQIGIGMYAINMMPNNMELGSVKDVNAIREFTNKAITQDGRGTDAAQGLDWAVKQMDAHKNPEHNQVIVLVGDGENSYMVNGKDVRTDADSNKVKDAAVAKAKAEGYKIFTMAINPTSSAFSKYFKDIADQTGGKSYEPKNDSEIGPCIMEILGGKGEAIPIPERTLVSRTQNIPIGSFEFDITCNHSSPVEITLVSPSGITYDKNSNGLEYRQDTGYTGYKIFEPESGDWTVKFFSDVEQYIVYNTIAHTDISLKLTCENTDIRAKEENAYNVDVLLQDKPIESDNVVKNLECKLIATNLSDNTITEAQVNLNGLKYEGILTLNNKGKYEIKAQLQGKEFTVESNILNVDITKNSTAHTIKIACILGLIAIIILLLCIIFITRLIKKSPDTISLRIKMNNMEAGDSINGKRTFYIDSDALATKIFPNNKAGTLGDVIRYFKATYINISGDEEMESYITRDVIEGCRSVLFKGTKENASYIITPSAIKVGGKIYDSYVDNVKVSSSRKIKFNNNSKFVKEIKFSFKNKDNEKEFTAFTIELTPINKLY